LTGIARPFLSLIRSRPDDARECTARGGIMLRCIV